MNLRKQMEQSDRAIDRLLASGNRRTREVFREALENSKGILAEFFEKYERDGRLHYDDLSKYNRKRALEREIRKELAKMNNRAVQRMRSTLRETFEESYYRTGWYVENATKTRVIPIMKDEFIEAALENEISGLDWATRMGRNREEIVIQINESITQGLNEGETYSQMAQRLNDRLSVGTSKAERIVRTEGHRIQEEAKTRALDGASERGIKMVKRWVTSADERVRDRHIEMEGQEVEYEEDFELPDGTRGRYPGAMGNAEDDINCRCIYVVEVVRVDADPSPTVQDISSLSEWKSKRMDAA